MPGTPWDQVLQSAPSFEAPINGTVATDSPAHSRTEYADDAFEGEDSDQILMNGESPMIDSD